MRLVRFGNAGEEHPGLVDSSGILRELSDHIDDIGGAVLSEESLQNLQNIKPETLPIVSGTQRFGVPVAAPGKVIAVGYNYRAHANEATASSPVEPMLFSKAVTCLSGAFDDVIRPPGATKLDWEVELGVVMGRRASYVSEGEALRYVAGYTVFNDVSERAYQFDRGGTWDKGKGCDTFGPIGPWLVTKDEIKDPQKLDLWLAVNDRRQQAANTSQMIFSVAFLVSYISQFLTLLPGDIIATGTPAGIGHRQDPPVYLQDGDVITLGIDQLGAQRQTVKTHRRSPDEKN
jgi:2,4-didehydro-3-deoxy-L-rhamnonate hydrolase